MKYLLVSSAILLVGPSGIVSQDIGKDICACSPSVYEFTLDFSLSCPPVNVEENDAVDRTSCAVTPFGDPAVTDLVPVAVESIDILELGQGLRILVQERITGSFTNGSTFNYTSLSATPNDIVDITDIPRAIQVNIVGTNKLGEALLNVYIITFSNSCDAYPVFVEGQSAGWTSFTQLEPPLREFCPFGTTASPTGLLSPTSAPTKSPIDSPTVSPTDETPPATEAPIAPTSTPSADATTRAPVPETSTPTFTPTLTASTEQPSTSVPGTTTPTGAPITYSPSELTFAPIAMSMSMSMNYGLAGSDFDSIVEEFGLLSRQVPKAKSEDSIMESKGAKSRQKQTKSQTSKLSKASKASKAKSSPDDKSESQMSSTHSSKKESKKRWFV